MGIDWIIFCYRYKTVATILYLIVGICPSLPLVFASVSMSYVTFPYNVLPYSPLPHEKLGHPPSKLLRLLLCVNYYMKNFCNLIGLQQWYFSLI